MQVIFTNAVSFVNSDEGLFLKAILHKPGIAMNDIMTMKLTKRAPYMNSARVSVGFGLVALSKVI